MVKNQFKLISFDVFDTLVTRRVGQPVGIFSLMENDLRKMNMPEILVDNFLSIRIEAEAKARWLKNKTKRTREVSLEDIYEIIGRNYKISDDDLRLLINLEIDVEKKNLVGISKNILLLKEYIKKGRVVLISDMYLSSKIIRDMLTAIDGVFGDINIYSSCDFGFSKAGGELYDIVRDIECVEYENWLHHGDNINSDINNAIKRGITAKRVEVSGFKPYEDYLLRRFFYSNSNIEVSIGCARLARMKGDGNEYYEFGVSFAGPIIFNYVDFVVERAVKEKVKKLFFIARDGYVLKKVADIIINFKGLDIETVYVYGSRAAWRIPDESNILQYLSMIFDEYTDRLTLNFISKRMFVPVNVLKPLFLIVKDENVVLSRDDLDGIIKKVESNDELRFKIADLFSERKLVAKEYLDGLIGNENTVWFVDMHGSGRTLDLLNGTFFDGKKCIKVFFMTSWVSSQSDSVEKITYYETMAFSHFWVELLCRAPHTQTLGYQKKSGAVVPILEEKSFIDRWQYDKYFDGICKFAKEMLEAGQVNWKSFNDVNLYKGLNDFFFLALDRKTARIMSKIPYYMVGDESKRSTAALPYKSSELIVNFMLNKGVPFSTFPNISLALSSKRSKKIFRLLLKHKSLIGYLKKKVGMKNDS